MTQYHQDQDQDQDQELGRAELTQRARQYHREASLRVSEMFGTLKEGSAEMGTVG